MEEILASIRRIIADDQEVLRGAARERGDTAASSSNLSNLANVLDLTERQSAMRDRNGAEPLDKLGDADFDRDELPSSDPEHSDNDLQLVSYHDEPEDVERARTDRPAEGYGDLQTAETLLSDAADASVSEAFTRLGSILMPTQPQTLEDLMKDLLRPMLKAWLDENLPRLVERLVQAEIDRLSRRR